jgi:hypothetical protein
VTQSEHRDAAVVADRHGLGGACAGSRVTPPLPNVECGAPAGAPTLNPLIRTRTVQQVVRSCIAALFALVAVGAAASHAAPAQRFLVVTYGVSSSAHQHARIYDSAGRLSADVVAPTTSSALTWSPDGSLLAIADISGLTVERADGSRKRRLVTRQPCTGVCLILPVVVWTPDGKKILVGGVDPRGRGLRLVEVASGHSQLLATDGALVRPLAVSPNGNLLAYTRMGVACNCASLVAARIDGSHARTLVRFHPQDGPNFASWSPDSTRVAFTEDARDPRDPRAAIVDIATLRLRSLDRAMSASQVVGQSPAWAPDGSRVALVRFGAPALTIAADGSSSRRLPVTATAAAWLRDGDLLLASGSQGDSLAIVHGRRVTTIARLPAGEKVLSVQERLTGP